MFAILFLASPIVFADATPLSDKSLHWYSILPPLIAISIAFLTRKILLSLGLAIFVGGILVALSRQQDWLLFNGPLNSIQYLFNNLTSPWNLKVLSFVFCILSMIAVMVIAGGLQGIVNYLNRFANSAKSTKLITALTGLLIFIDDYANTMIVGSSMRPINDAHRTSREKLAFIVDATSAPVAGLAIVSTWIGFETGLFSEVSRSLSLGLDGYAMFFDALGFRFYCILMLIFVFLHLWLERDYGQMYHAEMRAGISGKLLADDARMGTGKRYQILEKEPDAKIYARTALLPLAILFTVLLSGLWIDGGGTRHFQQSIFSLFSFTVWLNIFSHVENSSVILLSSALSGLVTAIACAKTYAKISLNAIKKGIIAGLKTSILPVTILMLAWSLKSACDDLETGKYIVEALGTQLSPLWFPALVFVIAAFTSFGTGTSWGTMSILIPIAVPVAFELDAQHYGIVTIITLGAVLDGSIFGDHCSPISDTTIMSSTSAQCDHLHHVKTQIPYSLTIAVIALLFGYIPAAFGLPSLACYVLGILAIVSVLLLFGRKLEIPAKH